MSDLLDDLDDLRDTLDDLAYDSDAKHEADFGLLVEAVDRIEAHILELERRLFHARGVAFRSGVCPPDLNRTDYEIGWLQINASKVFGE